jgi:hypothetical protein
MTTPKYPHARLSPAKDELLAIAITRESVVTHDVRPLLDKLLPLAATREAAIAWEGKVIFFFDSWDHDPRETADPRDPRLLSGRDGGVSLLVSLRREGR